MEKNRANFFHTHWKAVSLILAVIVLAVSIISLTIGYYTLTASDVFSYIFSFGSSSDYADITPTIVANIRLPRVLAALLIGSALAVSGCAYQGMFRNPLVSPDILGVTSGAAVGASLAITLGLSNFWVQVCALAPVYWLYC